MEVLTGPKDNIVEKLYTPGFKNCKTYRRQTAFFQPSVFKCWSGSLMDIVKNEVKLEILMGVSDSNFKILKAINNLETKKEKNKVLAKEANSMFEKSLGMAASSNDSRNRIRLIRYLYAKELLEIKLCISCDENQENLSLAHNKIGYFLKEDGEYMSFMGSMNESESAVMRNGEDLTVFNSLSEEENAKKFKDKLDEKWEETDKYSIVFTPTDEFIEKIKEISDIKDQKEALEVTKKILQEIGVIGGEEEDNLRHYQTRAIESWKQNNFRGILEHATGSGKTFTALNAIAQIFDTFNPIVIIGVPYRLLAFQWFNECEKFFAKQKIDVKIVKCWSDNKNWRRESKQALLEKKSKEFDKEKILTIFVVVNKTLFDSFESEIIQNENFDVDKTFFIGDECHNYSSRFSENLLPPFGYRLGLSATPVNDKSDLRDGEKEMLEYFGEVQDIYTLSDALNDPDPEGPFLTPYKYIPILCALSEEDFDQWHEDYKKSGWGAEDSTNDKSRQAIFRRMNLVLSSMDSKIEELKKLTKKNFSERQNSLVFVGEGAKVNFERNIKRASDVLSNNNWKSSSIVADTEDGTQTQKQRQNIINNFVSKTIDSICAIKILDEGIDVPSIKTAYILASSNSRRQFVQRRGRVLRLSKGKSLATIYDFIINPPKSRFNESGIDKIYNNEIKRMEEMGQDAVNKSEIDKFIKNYRP